MGIRENVLNSVDAEIMVVEPSPYDGRVKGLPDCGYASVNGGGTPGGSSVEKIGLHPLADRSLLQPGLDVVHRP